MTTRARLLAILKEPDRYFAALFGERTMNAYDRDVSSVRPIKESMLDREALALVADINARHRLKRLCEDIAKVASEQAGRCPAGRDYPTHHTACNELAAAILALGEPNEHS